MFRTLAAVLFGFSLLVQSHVVSADAAPYPAQILGWCSHVDTGSSVSVADFGCGFNSPTQACMAGAGGLAVDHFDMVNGHASGNCWYSDPIYPASPLTSNHVKWNRNIYCNKGGQEEDSRVAAPICSCRFFPPGYEYPSVFPNGDLSLCVPATAKCPVSFPEFGPPDPPALDMTVPNISPALRAAADCLKRETGLPDGALFESGYRTLEYQEHFQKLWDAREKLRNDFTPLCADVKKRVGDDFIRHGLGGSKQRPPVNPSNCHTAGTCFDAKSDYPYPNNGTYTRIDLNSYACNVYRPWPALVPAGSRDDPGHTILQ